MTHEKTSVVIHALEVQARKIGRSMSLLKGRYEKAYSEKETELKKVKQELIDAKKREIAELES